MRKQIITFFTIAILGLTTAWADEMPTPDQPSENAQPSLIPKAPNIDAKGYVLIDERTGNIIASKNPNKRMEPASLTKLMTLYLVFDALKQGTIKLDDQVRISEKAWRMGGSKMYIEVGKDVPVNELIQGVIVDSGNDATVALAEYVAGSESSFVDMMNIEAQRLGLKDTHFMDATGLPDKDHYTTPHDLAMLASDVYRSFPDQRHFFSEKWFTFNGIKQPNRNRLLWRYPGTTGLKTGHTEEAGFCLISSADKDDMTLITVVMGAPTDEARSDDSIRMLTYGFRFYKSEKLQAANTPVAHVRVWGGDNKEVALGLTEPLYVTVPTGSSKFVKTKIITKQDVQAPVKAGDVLGQIQVFNAGKLVSKQPLVALKTDGKGGLWTRATDSISRTFHGWFSKDKASDDQTLDSKPAKTKKAKKAKPASDDAAAVTTDENTDNNNQTDENSNDND